MPPPTPADCVKAELQDWLLDQTLRDVDLAVLFDAFCNRIREAGLPIDRASLVWPTLHPIYEAERVEWISGAGSSLNQFHHAPNPRREFLQSPFYHAITHGLIFLRRRLAGPGALRDFPVLEDFARDGYTDYVLGATPFRIAHMTGLKSSDTGVLVSWTTRRPEGFSDADIELLTGLQKVFGVACHSAIQTRVMNALGETYLGRTASQRVFNGDTRLGMGKEVRAVVWFSDLRGSTWLSSHIPPSEYLQYLRDYYDCTATPVLNAGGEILDFIGDGVLAIFPIAGDPASGGADEAVRAATRALDDALARLAAYRARPDTPPMQFTVSLAVGEMMFGNIGVPNRLSFSAIGAVVNAVARIDDLSKSLGRSALVTERVARTDPARWTRLGAYPLPDIDDPLTLYSLADERDRFSDEDLRESFRRGLG